MIPVPGTSVVFGSEQSCEYLPVSVGELVRSSHPIFIEVADVDTRSLWSESRPLTAESQ